MLAERPDNPDIKKLKAEVRTVRIRIEGVPQSTGFRGMLEKMIVPEIHVRDANPRDVIDMLQRESKNLTLDGSVVNFVWLIPADQKLPGVSLSLEKVPMLDAVNYIAMAAGLSYRLDAHAVVLYQRDKAGAPASKPAESPESGAVP
jgi:hypothetical protein